VGFAKRKGLGRGPHIHTVLHQACEDTVRAVVVLAGFALLAAVADVNDGLETCALADFLNAMCQPGLEVSL